MNRAKFPPVELSPPSDSDSVSFMTVPGASCSMHGASCSIESKPLGLVSVNSTESATDGLEKGEEQVEGGQDFRASSPKICSGLMLDVFFVA